MKVVMCVYTVQIKLNLEVILFWKSNVYKSGVHTTCSGTEQYHDSSSCYSSICYTPQDRSFQDNDQDVSSSLPEGFVQQPRSASVILLQGKHLFAVRTVHGVHFCVITVVVGNDVRTLVLPTTDTIDRQQSAAEH